MGPVARRWNQRPRLPLGRRSTQKKHAADVLEPSDHHLGRSRGGWGSKLHLVTDGNGIVLAVTLTAGQAHESKQLCPLMHAVRPPRHIGWPLKLGGDKGYSYDGIRDHLTVCGIEAVIPRKDNQPPRPGEVFDKATYRKRARVEQAVGWLKECRRIGTRYEKLGLNFLGFAKLGVIQRYLRILHPSDRA